MLLAYGCLQRIAQKTFRTLCALRWLVSWTHSWATRLVLAGFALLFGRRRRRQNEPKLDADTIADAQANERQDDDDVEQALATRDSIASNISDASSSSMRRNLSLFGLFSSSEKLAAVLESEEKKDEQLPSSRHRKLLERCLVETSRVRRLVIEEYLGCELGELQSLAASGKRLAKAAGRSLRSESCSRLRKSLSVSYRKDAKVRAVLQGALERYVATGRPYELAASVLRHTHKGASRAAIQALVFAHPPTTIARYCLVEAYYSAVAAAAKSVEGTSTGPQRTSARDFAMTSWLAVAADAERPLEERFLAVATVIDAADYCLEVRPDRRFLPDALDELQRLLQIDDIEEGTDDFCGPRLATKLSAVCRTRLFVRLGELVASLAAKGRDRDRRRRRREAALYVRAQASPKPVVDSAAERAEAAEAEVQASALSIVRDVLAVLDREYERCTQANVFLEAPHLVIIYQQSVVGGDARAGIAGIVKLVASDLPRFAALFFLLVDKLATKSSRSDQESCENDMQEHEAKNDAAVEEQSAAHLELPISASKDDGYMLRTYVALLFVCELCLSSSPRAILRHLDRDDSGDFVSKFLVGYRNVLDVLPSLFVKAHDFANRRLIDDSVSVNPYKPAAPRERIDHNRPGAASWMSTPKPPHTFQTNDLHRFSTHAFALRTHPSAANLLSTLDANAKSPSRPHVREFADAQSAPTIDSVSPTAPTRSLFYPSLPSQGVPPEDAAHDPPEI